MQPVIIALIAVRVVAIYLIALGISYLPTLYTMSVTRYPLLSAVHTPDSELISLATFFATLSPMISGILMWFIAPILSKWMCNTQENCEAASVSAAQIQAIAVSTAGLVIMCISLPELVGHLVSTFNGAYKLDGQNVYNIVYIPQLVTSALKVVFGLLLVLGVQFWVRILSLARNFGKENLSASHSTKLSRDTNP